jgi:hypothetical protein
MHGNLAEMKATYLELKATYLVRWLDRSMCVGLAIVDAWLWVSVLTRVFP